jgi:TldD protein
VEFWSLQEKNFDKCIIHLNKTVKEGSMKALATLIISRMPAEVEYADTRVISETDESVIVKNGKTESVQTSESMGFGVRVLVNGCWGFASTSKLDSEAVDREIKHAIQIAKASAMAKSSDGVKFGNGHAVQGSYTTPLKVNPFGVSLESKIDLLLQVDKILRESPGVQVSEAELAFKRIKKVFSSTEGSLLEQETTISGGSISAIAIEKGELQTRSYRNYGTAGYEFIDELGLETNAPRVRDEACQLLKAKPCPSGNKDLIIDGDQLLLQIHESIGHAVELDRVLGAEASYAGMSFVTTDKLDRFRYGSDIVNVTADATSPLGLGTFGWDDEGVPAQVTPIIREGIFVGYLSSRETAAVIGRESSAAMRADGWNRIPLVRMTNVNLEPGDWKLKDLIADTRDGLFVQTNRSWSIDDMRENFQFGVEFAREIKNGKLGDVVKDVTYTGYAPEFWGNCDAVCDSKSWKMYGVMNCGKGEPGQTMPVGHGTAPARFRGVRTGVFKK